MTRVLVSGCGGFAGHHFLEHVLINTGWDVVATDSFRHKGKTDRISEVFRSHDDFAAKRPWWSERTSILTHDLTAPFSEQAIDSMGEIDYIVAYASESHVDRSITDPVPFCRNNHDVALNTLELARRVKPKALVWISTDEVYGPVEADDFKGHKEWAPILPSNPYAASKAAQEALAISYWRTYGVPLILVNCMNMIGERQDPEKFVPLVLKKVLAGEAVTIHGTPGHIGTRHYLHARNLADAILFILEKQAVAAFPSHLTATYWRHGIPNRIAQQPDRYNVATPDRVNNLEMAVKIARYAGKSLKYEFEDFHSTRPGHDAHYGLDPSKLNALGWTPPVLLGDSVRKTIEWTIKNPSWLIAE